jgi:hypothetical protein
MIKIGTPDAMRLQPSLDPPEDSPEDRLCEKNIDFLERTTVWNVVEYCQESDQEVISNLGKKLRTLLDDLAWAAAKANQDIEEEVDES